MRHIRNSTFVFMLVILAICGIIGFNAFESHTIVQAFHTTVAVLTFSANSSDFSEHGKLLATALRLAAMAVIVWAYANFHFRKDDTSHHAAEYFRFVPKGDGLVLKEIKISKGGRLTGLTKIEILQNTGTVIMGIKKDSVYHLNIPFKRKLIANTKALFLGNPIQLKQVERQAKR